MLSDLARRGSEAPAAEAVTELLYESHVVADEKLPRDVVAIGDAISYLELPRGVRREVTLAFPLDADAASGRISVLSPVGLALLGRREGESVGIDLPDGRSLSAHLLGVRRSFALGSAELPAMAGAS
ncbi:MAG: GreA/GreB family elongation factor [Burkholderiales bacterium]